MAVLLLACPFGCRNEQKEATSKTDVDLADVLNLFSGMMSRQADLYPTMQPVVESCSYARLLAKALGDSAATPIPDPVAVYVQSSDAQNGLIFLHWLQKECSVSSFRVREFWPDGQLIEEVYDFPTLPPTTDLEPGMWSASAEVCIRHSPDQLRDDEAWDAWRLSQKDEGRERPPIFIAAPATGARVFVSLISEVGFESRSVEVGRGGLTLFMN